MRKSLSKTTLPFWPKRNRSISLFRVNGNYKHSHNISHITFPKRHHHLDLVVSVHPHGIPYGQSRGRILSFELHTKMLPSMHVEVGTIDDTIGFIKFMPVKHRTKTRETLTTRGLHVARRVTEELLPTLPSPKNATYPFQGITLKPL